MTGHRILGGGEVGGGGSRAEKNKTNSDDERRGIVPDQVLVGDDPPVHAWLAESVNGPVASTWRAEERKAEQSRRDWRLEIGDWVDSSGFDFLCRWVKKGGEGGNEEWNVEFFSFSFFFFSSTWMAMRGSRRAKEEGVGGKPGSFNWCLLQRRVNRDKACRCLKLAEDEGM